MGGNKDILLKFSPDIIWCVEQDHVLVIDKALKSAARIRYPGACVWDLLCQGHGHGKIISSIAIVFKKDITWAEKLFSACINSWVQAGYIIRIQ